MAAGKPKDAPIVFVMAGQHARLPSSDPPLCSQDAHHREWLSPAAAMVALESFAESAAKKKGLPGFQLSIVLLANPDGYAHTMNHDRMWRKNVDTANVRLIQNTVGKGVLSTLAHHVLIH